MPLRASRETNGAADSCPFRGNFGGPRTFHYSLDSMAKKHATGSMEVLSERGAAVGFINEADFVLSGVHYDPGLGPGRIDISVGQLASHGLDVALSVDSCRIKKRSTQELVGEGRLCEKGFYHFDFLRIPQN